MPLKRIVSQNVIHYQQLQCFLPSEILWSLIFGVITKGIPSLYRKIISKAEYFTIAQLAQKFCAYSVKGEW